MEKLIAYLPVLLSASLLTFALAICSLFSATLMGWLGAWGKLSSYKIGYENANIYTWVVRGIPDIVLLILVYYGVQRLFNVMARAMNVEAIELSVFGAGVLALGFIYGAYLTETFRGAYQAVPKGQAEAAQALGLSRFVTFRKVLLPQIIKHAIPGYGNVFQVLIKSTAVLSVIGFDDLVGLAYNAGKTTREPFIFMLFALLIYLVFYYLVGIVFQRLEAHYADVEHGDE